ncbi:hypothetical protein DFR86_09160 [Acidianus sulfidivorans JP7]|uniref:TFIIS-type domain-containing protein n=1 Tax=Acidianus sulfidivorans JP7 TaxID=619593 RepID=A0A2U9INS9_9CREN|nr:hypothetical protein [Acidianus sulfidivorans]AWR97699.1 hypothetical protein DFR86_09160 [Acidianus sulfidivorans JP7]
MKDILCPKCGIRMEFMAESESSGNKKEVRYFYRCPACGTRIIGSTMEITKKDNDIVIKILQ